MPGDPGFAALGSPVPGMPGGLGADYEPSAKVGAGLLTFFVPLISLIVALVLRGTEPSPVRRDSLRTWAVASGAWMAVQLLIGIVGIAAIASSGPQVSHNGPCIGGPDIGSTGVPVGGGNYRFDCAEGGSTIVHLGG